MNRDYTALLRAYWLYRLAQHGIDASGWQMMPPGGVTRTTRDGVTNG